MSQNLEVNGVTYNEVESIEMTNTEGKKVLYFEGKPVEVVQEAGESEEAVMSQKAVTDALTGYKIPDYWQTAVDEVVSKVNALQDAGGNDVVNFVAFSDVHYGGSKTYVGNIGNLSAAVMAACDIPLCLMAGDTLTAGANNLSTEEAVLNLLKEAMDDIYAPIGFDRLMLISGNHEDAYGKYIAEDGTVTHYTNKADPKKIWNKLYRPQSTDFRRVFGGNGTYFWLDNVPQKVRFVCLNSSYYDGEAITGGTTKAMTFAFGAEQLAWLEDTALKVDADWSVVVCVHVPPIESYAGLFSDSDYTEIRRIITESTAEIIAVFTGHMHQDNVDTTLPCPVISVICASNTPYDGTEAERVAGTDKETALDIVSINKSTKTINMTRLGNGLDREIKYGRAENIFDANKVLLNARLNSSHAFVAADGVFVTAWYPLPDDFDSMETCFLYIKGVEIQATSYDKVLFLSDTNYSEPVPVIGSTGEASLQFNLTTTAGVKWETLDASNYYYKIDLRNNATTETGATGFGYYTYFGLALKISDSALTSEDIPDIIMSWEPIE